MDMEFDKNAPTTAEDIARATIPHMTVQPTTSDIETGIPTANNSETKRTFAFETESTAESAELASRQHPHHGTAVILSILTVGVFLLILATVYFLR